jgi:hypothetical protein
LLFLCGRDLLTFFFAKQIYQRLDGLLTNIVLLTETSVLRKCFTYNNIAISLHYRKFGVTEVVYSAWRTSNGDGGTVICYLPVVGQNHAGITPRPEGHQFFLGMKREVFGLSYLGSVVVAICFRN